MALFRTGAIRQDVSKGVDTQAGVIRGARVIQLGDVNDSRPWYVDQETMSQVVKFGNQPNKGLKARFTHPNMSDDGMGNIWDGGRTSVLKGILSWLTCTCRTVLPSHPAVT